MNADQRSALGAMEFSEMPPWRRVFINRNLRMESIAAIGFDMDHTLAVYQTDCFNELCFDMARERLAKAKGYPAEIGEVAYDPAAAIRGLIVDKRLGNLLKVDTYNYVSRVRHGMRFLDREARRSAYKRGRILIGSRRYRVFDTLFDLPEGSLYAALVDLKDQRPDLSFPSYRTLYDDIRETVDTLHADDSFKAPITADLDRFFVTDPDLGPTLQKLRNAGKRLFLLTNSEPDYTAAVMHHLLADGGPWEEIFDLVICSARKPGFFIAQGKGRSVGRDPCPHLANRSGNCFTGGDSFFLESKLGHYGDAILYFGDHTFGDILRSKKSVGWRTAMIVPEVGHEVESLWPRRGDLHRLAEVEDRLEELVLERDRIQNGIAGSGAGSDDGTGGGAGGDAGDGVGGGADGDAALVSRLQQEIAAALSRRAVLQKRLKVGFNPYWESLFKEGRSASRFGRQVQEFACIYTSCVSNFLAYPVTKFFARPAEILPHERWALP